MRELALHLLDIAQNSLAAGARMLRIEVRLDSRRDRLLMRIMDDGLGMSPEMAVRAVDPFVTSRCTRRVGMGLPLLKAAAERCGGRLELISTQGRGTTVSAEFRLRHIDRAPLGDLPGTILSLIACNPEMELDFSAAWDDCSFHFSTTACREQLGPDIPLNLPAVLAYMRECLAAGLADLRNLDETAADNHMEGIIDD